MEMNEVGDVMGAVVDAGSSFRSGNELDEIDSDAFFIQFLSFILAITTLIYVACFSRYSSCVVYFYMCDSSLLLVLGKTPIRFVSSTLELSIKLVSIVLSTDERMAPEDAPMTRHSTRTIVFSA